MDTYVNKHLVPMLFLGYRFSGALKYWVGVGNL